MSSIVERLAPQAESTTSFGLSDEEFENLMSKELHQDPLALDYPEVFAVAAGCITKWRQRYRGDASLWKRLFHKDRVLKEFIEAAPVIDAVIRYVKDSEPSEDGKFTVIDLASGKGFLSMFLSELLPPSKVERLVLMDKAWAMHGKDPQPHHMNWDHIYGETAQSRASREAASQDTKEESDGLEKTEQKRQKYIETWPIPLTTSRQDLKHRNQRKNLEERFFQKSNGPVILLGIHLCGTLSLKAVNFFNENPKIHFFCLKPCCLPGMIHAKRDEVFTLGHHSFDSKLVCVRGKWNKDRWNGPNRSQMAIVFDTWAENLFLGIDDEESIKKHVFVCVQHNGGYQNDFLFAERLPATSKVWDELEKKPDKCDVERAT